MDELADSLATFTSSVFFFPRVSKSVMSRQQNGWIRPDAFLRPVCRWLRLPYRSWLRQINFYPLAAPWFGSLEFVAINTCFITWFGTFDGIPSSVKYILQILTVPSYRELLSFPFAAVFCPLSRESPMSRYCQYRSWKDKFVPDGGLRFANRRVAEKELAK